MKDDSFDCTLIAHLRIFLFANFIMNLQDLDGKQTGFLEELWDVRLDEIEVETDKSCKVIFSDGIEVIT